MVVSVKILWYCLAIQRLSDSSKMLNNVGKQRVVRVSSLILFGSILARHVSVVDDDYDEYW